VHAHPCQKSGSPRLHARQRGGTLCLLRSSSKAYAPRHRSPDRCLWRAARREFVLRCAGAAGSRAAGARCLADRSEPNALDTTDHTSRQGRQRAARHARQRSLPLAGKSRQPFRAEVDRRAKRAHRDRAGRDVRRQGDDRARTATGDHLDHAFRPTAGSRHAVLHAGNTAATAAAADGAAVAGWQAARAGRPQRQRRQFRHHRLLAVAACALSRLRHRRRRQRADHGPCAGCCHRQGADRRLAVGRRWHHAAGAGVGRR